MTTLELKKDEIITNPKELESLVLNTISFIENISNERDYFLDEKSLSGLAMLKNANWEKAISEMSRNQIKNLNRYIWRVNVKQSRQAFNMFFHFIHTRVLGKYTFVKDKWWGTYKWVTPEEYSKVKIGMPLKEQVIQNKRKKWKEAQAIADQLLEDYKEEKGDYYKLRSF